MRQYHNTDGALCESLWPQVSSIRRWNACNYKTFERIAPECCKHGTDPLLSSSLQLAELASTEGSLVDRWRESDLLFWIYQTAVLTRRSWKNMVRNVGVYWLRAFMYYTLTICIGTMFFRVGTSYASINDRVLILGFITGFYGFMSIAGFPGFIEDIKVRHATGTKPTALACTVMLGL